MLKTEELKLVSEWDKTFPKSEKVDHEKVTFVNRYGITLAADLYKPKNAFGKYPAIAVSGPFGAVKEQCSGDKLLNVMKEEEIGIAELARISGVPERTILDIMAGVNEPELGVMCKIAEGLGICVHELRADEERYAVSVPKDTLAKLIVVSEINNVELEELINCILEKGIEEHGFYA